MANASRTFLWAALPALLLLILAGVVLRAADPDKKTDSRPSTAFNNVGVQQFDKLRTDKKNVILDVRTPREFAAGHIPGATNIDVNAPDFEKKVKALDTNTTYLVHCAAGVRSAKACDKLGKLNFGHLYNLEGGFRAWEKAGNKAEH